MASGARRSRLPAACSLFLSLLVTYPFAWHTQASPAAETSGAAVGAAVGAADSGPGLPAPEQSPGGATDSSGDQKPLKKAPSIDLAEPITALENPAGGQLDADALEAIREKPVTPEMEPLIMLGTEVLPLTSTRLSWAREQSFEGLASATPVLVVHGGRPGPVLCLTAALHGDELNGVEIVRRVLYSIEPEELSGTLIGVPIVNLLGFQRSSRYLPDRRDLNRHFPGQPNGSSASRIAYSFFNDVIQHCTALVDLHTGSFDRINLPQLRADLSKPDVVDLTKGFGATVVLQGEGGEGTLRRATVESGIPAVTLEAGGPLRLQESAVKHSVKGIKTLLNHLGMVKKTRKWGDPEPVYYSSTWVRAERGGILFSEVALGAYVKRGDLLGAITNPITNVRMELHSPYNGRVLGMALNQVVMPGYAAYHIGISTPPEVEAGIDSKIRTDQADERASRAGESRSGGSRTELVDASGNPRELDPGPLEEYEGSPDLLYESEEGD